MLTLILAPDSAVKEKISVFRALNDMFSTKFGISEPIYNINMQYVLYRTILHVFRFVFYASKQVPIDIVV